MRRPSPSGTKQPRDSAPRAGSRGPSERRPSSVGRPSSNTPETGHAHHQHSAEHGERSGERSGSRGPGGRKSSDAGAERVYGRAGSRGAAAPPPQPARKTPDPPSASSAARKTPVKDTTNVKTPILSYLKVFGLNQYARAFAQQGLADLDAVARLSEAEALEFLEQLHVYPGHRLKLLRAIDCLRFAAMGADRTDASKQIEDDAALDRLCEHNEQLSLEKKETEEQNKILQEENHRLLAMVRKQDQQMASNRTRIAELEELVTAQTEQVNFLAQQLQLITEVEPSMESTLYKSYRDHSVIKDVCRESMDDWGTAQKMNLDAYPAKQEAVDLASKTADTTKADPSADDTRKKPESVSAPNNDVGTLGAKEEVNANCLGPTELDASPKRPSRENDSQKKQGFSPPQRGNKARLAQSFDSAQITECLAGFDVDKVVRCSACAIQNDIILAVGKARPHTANAERLAMCSVYMEPAHLDILQKKARARKADSGSEDLGSPISLCSPLMSKDSKGESSLSPNSGEASSKEVDLNNLAVRKAPTQWDIYGFLRDAMVGFRLQPEVSVIMVIYLRRFQEKAGIALTPDNWQRLSITAMMLASKVWDDESFENIEFSQLCPLYTLDEINTFERIFLKSVGYDMSCRGSQYAQMYFLLRTLGAKDNPDFGGLAPLDTVRASRLHERCLQKQIEWRDKAAEEGDQAALNWTM